MTTEVNPSLVNYLCDEKYETWTNFNWNVLHKEKNLTWIKVWKFHFTGSMSGDATLSRQQVKYCSVLNNPNGSMAVDSGQAFSSQNISNGSMIVDNGQAFSRQNISNGSMMVDGSQVLPRRYVAQNGGRRNELWLVW